MKHLLSTKALSLDQREHILNAGFGLVERNFISAVGLDFTIQEVPENIIFTSANAVRIILSHSESARLRKGSIFAVGEKTARLLSENGFSVKYTADYATVLADQIIRYHSKERFLFLCGRRSLPELPQRLNQKGVALQLVEVYDTRLRPTKIDRTFDGVLFYSPSGVRSYCKMNDLSDTIAFCIGTTTASEAKKFTEKIVTATRPSVENVIVQVVKYFNH